MFGKKKLALGVASVVALTTLAGAGIASAHGGGVLSGGDNGNSIIERAAEILGISSSDLTGALQQARADVARDKLAERLTAAVDDGTITQDEMDQILSWVDARPAVVDEIAPGPHIGVLPLHAEGSQARLDALVEAGTITQDQADEITAWLDSAPDAISAIAPDRGGFGPHGFMHRGPRVHHGEREFEHHGSDNDDDDSGSGSATQSSDSAA